MASRKPSGLVHGLGLGDLPAISNVQACGAPVAARVDKRRRGFPFSRILGSGSAGQRGAVCKSDYDARAGWMPDLSAQKARAKSLADSRRQRWSRSTPSSSPTSTATTPPPYGGLAKLPTPIQCSFANRATAQALQRGLKHTINWQLFETGSSSTSATSRCGSFAVPHDAQDPVGFLIAHGHDDLLSPRRSLAWLTDLGHAPGSVREHIREADVLVVEANHCSADAPSRHQAPVEHQAAHQRTSRPSFQRRGP